MTKQELETQMRAIVKNQDEYAKVDQKSAYNLDEKKDRLRLVKCLAAIANSDDTHFENVGYIILGAKKGRLIGGFDVLEKDSTTADIQNCVGAYIDPTITFSVERFRDELVGWWGVIVVSPSSEIHVFKKDCRENTLSIRKGDVYVRHGDSTVLAEKLDYDRLNRRKYKNRLDHLEKEISVLKEKVEEQRALKPELKVFFQGQRNNRLELIEISPTILDKTKEQLEEEQRNKDEIKRLEEELRSLTREMITTSNRERVVNRGNILREELQKQKLLYYEIQQHDPLIARTIKLDFTLSNDGNALASGIRAYIYFPAWIKLAADMKSLKPDLEDAQLDRLMNILPDLPASSVINHHFPPSSSIPEIANPKYGGPEITERNDENIAEYWIDKLLHHHSHRLNPIYFISPDTSKDIDITYNIYTENAPGVSVGSLRLNLRPKEA